MLTFASRVLGLLRETAYSHFFGASPLLSAFRVAFQIPNLARRLFGEGALSCSFIPVFTRTRHAEGDSAAKHLAGGVFTLLATVLSALLVVTELGMLIAGWFVWGPTMRLAAILMPYMVLICVTALFAGVLNSLNRFAAPAIAPMILNVVVIAATWAGGALLNLAPDKHLVIVAISVLVAGVLQLALQLRWLYACDFSVEINFNWSSPGVRRVITLMAPMMVGLSVVQINTFADSMIALFLVPDGRGPAVLGYAQYMSHLPLGIFAAALATAIFPMLAQRAAAGDDAGFVEGVETGLRTCLFITIPAAVGLILIAEPLIRILFEHGEFSGSDTRRVALALTYYCLGLWAYSVQHILVRAFYAMEDSKTPVRIAVAMLALNLSLNIALVFSLREAGVALATAVTGAIQALLLGFFLGTRLELLRWRPIVSTALRSLAATGVMAVALLTLRDRSLFGASTALGEAGELLCSVVAGVVVYFVAAKLLRQEELSIVLQSGTRT